MKEVRCPDCGYRLKTNQCPICLKRVPFPVVKKENTSGEIPYTQPRCAEETPGKHLHIPVNVRKKARETKKPKLTAVIAAVIALISLLSSIAESCSFSESDAEPDYNYEAYIPAGVGEASDVSNLEAQCVYDADGITITVDGMGLYYDSYAIPVTVANNTDWDLLIHGNELSVNSYMMPSASLYCEAEAGEEVQAFLILSDYDLEEMGITEIAEVAFWLDIYEDEDYTNVVRTDLITLQTELADGFVQPVDDSGVEVYATEDVRLVIKEVEMSDYDYCSIVVFAQNNSDATITLGDEGISLNGESANGMLWSVMRSHTQILDRIYIDDLEELGIESEEDLQTLTIQMEVWYQQDEMPRETIKTMSETIEIDLTGIKG